MTVSTTRTDWIDAAKGAAILLVVIGHAWRAIAGRNLISPDLFQAVDARIYAFHMPVFFALSGMFLTRSLVNKSTSAFIASRLKRLIWPMILWTYLFLGAQLLAGGLANNPVNARDLMVSPIPGRLHLWFLWALFLLHIAFFATRALVREGTYPPWAFAGLATLSILLVFAPWPGPLLYWIGPALHHMPFLVLGLVIGQYMGRPNIIMRTLATIAFGIILIVWPALSSNPVLKLAGGLILTSCFLVFFAGMRPQTLVAKGLIILGTASMAIYLSHTIFSAAMREALLAADLRDPGLHMLLATLVGVIAPLCLLQIARRTGTTRLLGF